MNSPAMPDRTAPGLSVGPGECVVLLGPDETARQRLVTALARDADAPSIVVTPHDRLFDRLDVGTNLGFPLRARGIPAAERDRLAAELLALAGLEREAGRMPVSLAASDRVRLLIARGIATGRARLILIEPGLGLGAAERDGLDAMIRRIAQRRQMAVVVITADRTQALSLGDRVGVLDRAGQLLRIAPPAALLADPGSAEAAAALGGANLLVARVGDACDPDEVDVRLACGRTMVARLASGVGAGDLCLVAVPPDRIALAPIPAERMGGSAIPATLVEHKNLGTHLRLRLRLEDGTAVTVHRPTGALSSRDAARAAEPLGACIAWRAADATAFPHPDR